MEYEHLSTDEKISTLRIGDEFKSFESQSVYIIIDLKRRVGTDTISGVKTNIVERGSVGACRDGHWWSPNIYGNFRHGLFKKVVKHKDYDPEQQPFDEDDI